MSPPVDRRDRGLSIVELMISVTVMAVIATVLLAVVATFLRNDASAAQRIDESRDLQQLSAYLPLDVASAFLTELEKDTDTGDTYLDATDPDAPIGCSGWSGTGSNVLQLDWSEIFGGESTRYRVQYRTTVVGDETQLVRLSCKGATLGAATANVVARQLRTTDPVEVEINGGHVEITLHEKTGRTLVASATTQNPNADLDPTEDEDE